MQFAGWPEKHSIFMNFRVKDEHDNTYLPVNFGIGTRPSHDEGGGMVNPGESATAVVVFEKPVDASKSLFVELDGEAIGRPELKLRWRVPHNP
jgi:hypothetical protein